MNNIIVKEFNGNKIHTFMWNDKPCWIANEIVSMFEYADSTKTVQDCIKAEEFEVGVEYEVLKGKTFKEFATTVKVVTNNLISNKARTLTIFYEDGLYGFLQYTDKPIGVQFRKWIRRDVLPEVRETGAYITEKANPKMLRNKADEIERMATINESAKIIIPVLEKAGLNPQILALTTKTLYGKAGIELPIGNIKADDELYDLVAIASKVGIYSKSNKPHAQAVGAIIKQLDIPESEKELTYFDNHGHQGTSIKYKSSVIDMVNHWINDHNKPTLIEAIDKNNKHKKYNVVYRNEVA